MYKGHFWPLQVPLWRWGGPKYGYFWGQNRVIEAGLSHDQDSTLCAISHLITWPNMTKGHFWPLHAPLWHWRGPNYGHYGGQNRAGWLQDNDSAWKPFCAPYHTFLYGQTWLRAIFDLSMHPYGTGEVQTMAIMEVKTLHNQKWIRVIFLPFHAHLWYRRNPKYGHNKAHCGRLVTG